MTDKERLEMQADLEGLKERERLRIENAKAAAQRYQPLQRASEPRSDGESGSTGKVNDSVFHVCQVFGCSAEAVAKTADGVVRLCSFHFGSLQPPGLRRAPRDEQPHTRHAVGVIKNRLAAKHSEYQDFLRHGDFRRKGEDLHGMWDAAVNAAEVAAYIEALEFVLDWMGER